MKRINPVKQSSRGLLVACSVLLIVVSTTATSCVMYMCYVLAIGS
jgi:hypothetical protein